METSYVFASGTADVTTMSAGLLIARLVLGLYMAAHGAQKLFGWFGGYGLAGTAGFFEQIGFRPGRLFVVTASVTELLSGLLVMLGLLGPIGPGLMLSVLIVAAVSVHWRNGLFVTSNGIEHPLVFGASAFALALTGPGLFSFDTLLGLESFWSPGVAWTARAVGLVAGFANVAMRRHPTTTAGA